jgi:hypothetical protein
MNKKSKGDYDASPHDEKELPIDPKKHGRESYEKKYNCKLIKWADLMDNPWDADLGMRLKQLARYGNVDSVMLIMKPEEHNHGKDFTRIHFFTADHVYSISIHWKDKKETSYLGCTVSTRKNRPGEIWNRGNDLPDGKYNDETWEEILRSIIRYEMKTLQI